MAGQTSGAIVNDPNAQKDERNIFQPLSGETPYAQEGEAGIDRSKPGEGGSLSTGKILAWDDFTKLFGRNPTASELAMLAPAYASGDKNISNRGQGSAAIAQYYNTYANSPENINAQKQKQNQAGAPKYYDQVNQMFQGSLQRDATDEEKQHFGGLMASGDVDAYTVQQFLTALPEAVQKQDADFRTGLNKTLQGQDSQYYSEQILPALQAQASKQGRSLDSSGVQNSLALAAQQQNRQRESFLGDLTASQYRGSQGLAQDAYARAYGAQQDMSSYSLSRNANLTDAYTGRLNSISDYNMQKQAYDDYLRRYGKRSGGGASGAIQGAFSGGMTGAMVGGPWGAVAGAGAGAGLGYFG